MATVGSLALTYADWAKRMDDGKPYRYPFCIRFLK